MAKALTASSIEKLKPAGARREIADGLLAGLYLVIQPSGAKSWAVRYRFAGQPRKLTLGSLPAIDLSSARRLARRALVAVAEGRDPCQEKKAAKRSSVARSQDRFDKIADDFIERYAKANTRESTWRETERLLRKDVVPVWKGRAVQEITRRDVIELLDSKVDAGSPIMANRVLAAVRRLFGWSAERGIIEASPCMGVKAPAAERSRDRILSDDELRLVWNACEGIGWPFGPLTKLLILTAQRRDEVGEMGWAELDLGAGLWSIPRERTKNDLAHEVPLSNVAVEIVRTLPKVGGRGGYVFTTNGVTAVGGFSRAKDRLDAAISEARGTAEPLLRWTFHDLRRTAASGMARLGINLPVIEKVLNHTSGSFAGIVGVYQRHSFADEKRHALEGWARFVMSLQTPSENVVQLRATQT
jgi:integrase